MQCSYVGLLLIILHIEAVMCMQHLYDIKKAFDMVNHYKMFVSLMKSGIPLCIVAILKDWYSKLFVSVRWNNHLSYLFPVCSGVRQGSLFITDFIFCVNESFYYRYKESGSRMLLIVFWSVVFCMLMT